MDVNFKFSNIFGSVYRGGEVLFTNDGNSVISPVGNKISVFDLKNNVSRTLALESVLNITSLSLNHCGTHLIVANEAGQILYVNLLTEAIVFKFRTHRTVNAVAFCPDSKFCAITRGGDLQIHEILPSSINAFSPLLLKKTYKLCKQLLTTVNWSTDTRMIVAGGEDKIVRVVASRTICNANIVPLASHKAELVCTQFFDGSYDIISVDRRGQANCWKSNMTEEDVVYGKMTKKEEYAIEEAKGMVFLKYEKMSKANVCDSSGGGRSVEVSSAKFHPASNLLVTAFANGVFVLHELPSFNVIHSLRVSQLNVSSVAISPSGDWLALGCGRGSQGQLVVWEWQSETYVMKQQSHQLCIKSSQFSPDGSLLATAAEDGKVKVWNCRSSFCIVTFDEHTAAATGVAWTQSGKALLSCSLDGTVRARDIKRYRNFRTLVCPEPTPLGRLAVDATGDIVVASATEVFQIFVWSMENGQLLDVLSGHCAPIGDISIKGNTLASTSWDKTVRVWNLVDSSCEAIDVTGEGIAVSFAPTQPLIAILSMDSTVALLDSSSLTQLGSIDVKFDLDASRLQNDKLKKESSEKSKTFTSLAFSPDSSLLLLGGQSNHFCLYSVEEKLLLRRFTMTINRSFDGVDLDIKRRNYSEFGNMHLIETSESEEEMDGRKAIKLAGTRNEDKGERRGKPEAIVHDVTFCPTGRRFAVCSTEGVQMYSRDTSNAFDPFQLESTMSTMEVKRLLHGEQFTRAIKGSLQLGDTHLIKECVEKTPITHIPLVCSSLSLQYCERLLRWMADSRGLIVSSRLQLYLKWLHSLLNEHGAGLKEKRELSLLTAVQQTVQHYSQILSSLTQHNCHSLEYLLAARKLHRIEKEEEMEE